MREELFSDEHMNKAFALAYVLHPTKPLAYSVTLDALDRYFVQKNTQNKRKPGKKQPFKIKLSNLGLLQTSVYLASDKWEKDQESSAPKLTPSYIPNVNDLIIRYIKYLIWETIERNSSYVAVGIGSLLYKYRPSEISELAEDYFKEDNIRRNKMILLDYIRERFEQYNIVTTTKPKELISKVPNENERKIIRNSLIALAPFVDDHADVNFYESYFGYNSQRSEWERNHALIDEKCAGFPRIIKEFNTSMGINMQLEKSDEMLEIPDFGASLDSDKNDRFTPPNLSETELISLRRTLEQNQRRRELYHPGRIRLTVDGKDQILNRLENNSYDKFAIPSNASYLEVYGEDSSGELLLAVVPLRRLDFDSNEVLDISIDYGDDTLFNLYISQEGVDELSVKIEYENSVSEELNQFNEIDSKRREYFDVAGIGNQLILQGNHNNILRKFLWSAAGADPAIVEQPICKVVRPKYTGLGVLATILLLFSSVSSFYLFFLATGSPSLALAIGVFWGVLIFSFDRIMISTFYYKEKRNKYNVLFFSLPRIFLACIISILITESLLLIVFQPQIRAEMQIQSQIDLQVERDRVTSLFSPETAEIENKIALLKDEIDKKYQIRQRLYEDAIKEAEGTFGSGKLGQGNIFREKMLLYEKANAEFESLRMNNEIQISDYREILNKLNSERDSQLKHFSDLISQSNRGLLENLNALNKLQSTNPIVLYFSLLLFAILIFLNLTPFLIGIYSRNDIYNLVLETTYKDMEEQFLRGELSVSQAEVEKQIEELKNNVVRIFPLKGIKSA